jgi:hypothetical protein
VADIARTLCDPALLGQVIQLPSFSPFDLDDLVGWLCDDRVNVTASVFKDAQQSSAIIAQVSQELVDL